MPFYFDSSYLLIIIGMVLAMLAQGAVRSAYNKYLKVETRGGQPASLVAQEILQQNGAAEVSVVPIPGTLTDHYDPRNQTLGLSQGVFGSSSVAALGIAAHEAGHALQKHTNYAPLALRSMLVPVVQIGSNLSVPIFILGLVMSMKPLVTAGIVLFSLAVLFTLVTLPVEFDASRRAIKMLTSGGYITADEEAGVRKVLNAAALTYVSSAIGAMLQLIRLIGISRSRD